MNDFLHKIIVDNTVLSLLLCFGTILLVFFIKKTISKYIAGFFFRVFKKSSWVIDKKSFVDLMVQPLSNFVLTLVIITALDRLTFPSILHFDIFRTNSQKIINSLSIAFIIIFFIWLMLRMIDFFSSLLQQKAEDINQSSNAQIVVFFGDFFKIILGLIGILLLLKFALHKDISALLGGVGIATAAIALAAKESLENLIASFIIFFNKPFHIGDLVKVNTVTGNIEKIGLRSTRIRTDQKTYVTVPNKQMVDSVVDNLTLRTQRRVDMKLEIYLSTTADQLQHLINGINKIITQQPEVNNKLVILSDIAASGYIVHVEYYTSLISNASFNDLKQRINFEIIRLLESLQIKLSGVESDMPRR